MGVLGFSSRQPAEGSVNTARALPTARNAANAAVVGLLVQEHKGQTRESRTCLIRSSLRKLALITAGPHVRVPSGGATHGCHNRCTSAICHSRRAPRGVFDMRHSNPLVCVPTHGRSCHRPPSLSSRQHQAVCRACMAGGAACTRSLGPLCWQGAAPAASSTPRRSRALQPPHARTQQHKCMPLATSTDAGQPSTADNAAVDLAAFPDGVYSVPMQVLHGCMHTRGCCITRHMHAHARAHRRSIPLTVGRW